MNYRYCIKGDSPLRASFDMYLDDHHAAQDRITTLGLEGAKQLLRDLYADAPHAVSKALAIRHPWSPEEANDVETAIQEMLPMTWREQYDVLQREAQRTKGSSR